VLQRPLEPKRSKVAASYPKWRRSRSRVVVDSEVAVFVCFQALF
jgi:hypothetical protein